jgi:hypothetical protein
LGVDTDNVEVEFVKEGRVIEGIVEGGIGVAQLVRAGLEVLADNGDGNRFLFGAFNFFN